MKKQDCDNPLGNQVRSLTDLADTQLDICFSDEVLHQVMTMAEICSIRRIYITGCGDSIAAAGVMAGVMKEYSQVFHCQEVEPMDFSRFMKKEELGAGEPDSPLVIAISAGGGTARIQEILRKSKAMGAFTILLTNNRESASAREANRVFCLNTPKMPKDFPGLRSYFASMIGLIALALRIGHVRGVLPPSAPLECKEAVSRYVHSYSKEMERMENQMFALAEVWKEFERFEFIGDGPERYSALFALEKFVEVTGTMAGYDDSEDWCHIGYHLKNPETVGTILFADCHSEGYERERETAQAACGIGRPLLVITNGAQSDFPKEAHVCRIPDTPKEFRWLMPLMDYAPAAILAGYCAVLAGRKFFNEYDPIAHVYNGGNVFFNQEIMTMKNSVIEVHV